MLVWKLRPATAWRFRFASAAARPGANLTFSTTISTTSFSPFATGEVQQGLRVVEFTQLDSRFLGAEANLDLGLHNNLWLNLGMDFVDAQETLNNTPLPRIPPLRGRAGFDFRLSGTEREAGSDPGQ